MFWRKRFILAAMKDFSRKLIRWYESNKRDLPWRNTTEPYRIWLSEVILQQTRVDQGLSYYHKFLVLFPDVRALANASEDTVLKAWQGLGYYSRARNLHQTAKFIVSNLDGRFPDNYDGLIHLKGIGPYTAAAIASFSFGEKKPVIDGNVVRVLSRIFGVEHAVDTPQGKTVFSQLAEELIDQKHPATFNQAIMEFGALNCTPKQPGCESCPFNLSCVAYRSGRVADFPFKKKKTAVKNLWLTYFHIEEPKHIWLKRRGAEGIWKGLYDFPGSESLSKPDLEKELSDFLKVSGLKKSNCEVHFSEEYVHILTHRKIHARFVRIRLSQKLHRPDRGWKRVLKADLETYGIPRLIDKYLTSLDVGD